ncbi:hypothetical protein RND81_03G015300 [Saponaria officinalis]
MGFLGQGESTHLSREGLQFLCGMSPEDPTRGQWVFTFLKSCVDTRRATKGKIPLGGMVTLIALSLGLDLSGEEAVPGSPRLTITALQNMRIIVPLARGEAYALLVGTRQKVPYLRLPRPEGTAIPVGPTSRYLFIARDPDHLLGVVEEEGDDDDEDDDDDDDDVAEEGPGEREVGESSQLRAPFDDQYWRATMEDNMEELRDELGYLRDQNVESLALTRSFSDMYLQLHPTVYQPPPQQVYDEIAQRHLARSARAEERTRRARQRSFFGACFGSSSG